MDSQQNVEKDKDENAEDYSVVAQRFLNIFRQLHVFTPERKQSFDDAILALPPEVRGNFSKLLGGSVLQEHVDELEKKTGNESTRDGVSYSYNSGTQTKNDAISNNMPSDKGTELLLAKVLESSQKNAQAAAQAQMQFQANFLETMKNMPQTSSSTHSIDNIKLEEMVNSLVKSQLASVKSITTQAIGSGSSIDANKLEEMVSNLIKSQLATSKDVLSKVGGVVDQTDVIDKSKLENIISNVVKSQAGLIADATRIQTEQLSKAINAGLRESYNSSTQSIIEVLKTMNRDSVDALRESFRLYASTQKPIMVSNYNVAGAAPAGIQNAQNFQIAENTPKEIVYDKAPAEFYYETDNSKTPPQSLNQPSPLQDENDSNAFETLSRNQRKKKKKNRNKNNEEANLQQSFSQDISLSENEDDNINDFSLPDEDSLSLDGFDDTDFVISSKDDVSNILSNDESNNWDWVDNSENTPSETPILETEALSFTQEDVLLKDEEINEDDYAVEPDETIDFSATSEIIEPTSYKEDIVEYAEEETEEAIDTYSNDQQNTTLEEWKSEEPATNSYIESDTLLAALEPENEDDLEWDEEENIAENYENKLVSEVDSGVLPIALESEEEEWEYVEEETIEEEQKTIVATSPEEEWEYVEVSDEDNEEEYEWEYVDEETSDETVSVATSEEKKEEWEWVEEETVDEDGEWEWEYEEVPEDEKTLVDQEPITFEEEYLEPEGEYTKKTSPISSDGIIEQESIFKFSPTLTKAETLSQIEDENGDSIPSFAEESDNLSENISFNDTILDEDTLVNHFDFDEELSGSDELLNFEIEALKSENENIPELEDYMALEELDDDNNFMVSENSYFDIQSNDNNNIIEDLETIDIDAIEGDDIKLGN